jgi:hypothetical protein
MPRPYFDHYAWDIDASRIHGPENPICIFKHPIPTRELRLFDTSSLLRIADHLIACADHLCHDYRCFASVGENSRQKVLITIDRVHRLIEGAGQVVPVGIVNVVGLQQVPSSRQVLHSVVMPQLVQREVLEEHVYQPPPRRVTERRTIMHQGGREWVAGVEMVERGADGDSENGRESKKGGKRMIKERGESRSRSRDRGHGYRSRSRSHDREERRRRSRSRSRDRSHGRHGERDRLRSRSKSHDRRKSLGKERDRREHGKDKDRKKHERRSRSRERSRRRDRSSRHDYEESEREYDSSPRCGSSRGSRSN